MRSPALFLLAVCFSAGCKVGPDYRAPEFRPPASFRNLSPGENADTSDLRGWWKTLQDPLLDDLVERAIAANLDLRAAEARVREARAARGIIQADLWPNVDVTGAYTHRRTSPNATRLPDPPGGIGISSNSRFPSATIAPGPNGVPQISGPSVTIAPRRFGAPTPVQPVLEQSLYEAGFDMTWELDVFGGTRRAVDAAAADIQVAEEDRNDVLVTLLAEVARNYVELRGAQRRLQVAERNIEAQRESAALAESRFQARIVGELDVAQAQAQLATTQSQLPILQTELARAVHRLGVLLGEEPAALWDELEAPAAIPEVPPAVPVGIPSDVLRRRPDVRRAERELAAATARIGEATADLFPRFSLTGSFGLQSATIEDMWDWRSRAFSIGPSVRWPLFDAWRIRSNIAVRDAQQEQALIRLQQTVLVALEEVENALVAYTQEKLRYERLQEAVDANRRAVELSNLLYSRGLTNFLDVLDAQRSLYASEDQLIQSERAVVANLIALYKALGGGWE